MINHWKFQSGFQNHQDTAIHLWMILNCIIQNKSNVILVIFTKWIIWNDESCVLFKTSLLLNIFKGNIYFIKIYFRREIWREQIILISRVRKQRITIVQDAVEKQLQAAYDTNSRLNFFMDRRLRNCQWENNINVISAQKLDTQVI